MNNKDIKVLEKVYANVDNYDWDAISEGDRYYRKIDYPADAIQSSNVYYSQIKRGLIIVSGTYLVRFYYEEDNYTWDKKYFASLISERENIISSIAFITNDDYVDMIANKDLFGISRKIEKQLGGERPNIIVSLYDIVNRKVSGADELYSEFLDDE